MKRTLTLALLFVFACITRVGNLAAQDLVITNARIIVGNGTVIDQGSIVVMGPNTASYIEMGDQLGTLETANSPIS